MQTTTATYSISVTTDENATFYKTMPTKPTTSKGIKSQNTKLSKWVEKNILTLSSTKFFLHNTKGGRPKCPYSVSINQFFLSSHATFFKASFYGC